MVNVHALYHEAKNIRYIYATNPSTLHFRFRTAKQDVAEVQLICCDPFDWQKKVTETIAGSVHHHNTADDKLDHEQGSNMDAGDYKTDNHDYEKVQSSSSFHESYELIRYTHSMNKEFSDLYFDYWFASVNSTKRTKYFFRVTDNFKQSYNYGPKHIERFLVPPSHTAHISNDLSVHSWNANDYDVSDKTNPLSNCFNFPYINEADIRVLPDWVQSTIWYQVFPERFCNGDPSINPSNIRPWNDTQQVTNDMRFGGDLQGIINKLDYIASLGFTGLYFTPIFKSPSSHKYDVVDYYSIDENFGDCDTFKRLVQEAHRRNIKIMLDAVFNHCAFSHPWFQDVVQNGSKSQYFDAFFIHRQGDGPPDLPLINFDLNDDRNPTHDVHKDGKPNFETFAFTPSMPKINTDHPLMRSHLLDIAEHWTKEYNIDAWRLDVSNEVSHNFWRHFRSVVKAINPNIYILGENWDNSNPWVLGDQFDATMNYEFTYPVWRFFRSEDNIKPTLFVSLISKLLVDYPKDVASVMFNLVDSHDTARIFNICGHNLELVKLVYLFLMTFPGCPSIYYGGENGMDGDGDPLCRKCMNWDESSWNHELRTYLIDLIKARKKYASFRDVDLKFLSTNDDPAFLVYRKQSSTHHEQLYVIINRSDIEVSIPLPDEVKCADCLLDVLMCSKVQTNECVTIRAFGSMLLLKTSRNDNDQTKSNF